MTDHSDHNEHNDTDNDLDPIDAEQLALLDRVQSQYADLDLKRHEIGWIEMPDDGSQALVIDGGGLDGNNGFLIASHGEDLHVTGPTAPLIPGYIGLMVIKPDGTRHLASMQPDPLA